MLNVQCVMSVGRMDLLLWCDIITYNHMSHQNPVHNYHRQTGDGQLWCEEFCFVKRTVSWDHALELYRWDAGDHWTIWPLAAGPCHGPVLSATVWSEECGELVITWWVHYLGNCQLSLNSCPTIDFSFCIMWVTDKSLKGFTVITISSTWFKRCLSDKILNIHCDKSIQGLLKIIQVSYVNPCKPQCK